MALPSRVVLSGNQAFLRTAIMDSINEYYRLKNLDVEGGGSGDGRPPISPEFEDWLRVTIIFRGFQDNSGKQHKSINSFRIKGVDPKTAGLDYYKALGTKILNKFNTFSFRTGKIKATYTDWKKGYQMWGYFESQAEANRVFESILDLQSHSLDLNKLVYKISPSPATAYPSLGEKIQIAGRTVRTSIKAPSATMKFAMANITFPWIAHTEKLCSLSGYIISDLGFLALYED